MFLTFLHHLLRFHHGHGDVFSSSCEFKKINFRWLVEIDRYKSIPHYTILSVNVNGGIDPHIFLETNNEEPRDVYNGSFYLKYGDYTSSTALNYSSSAEDFESALSRISVLSLSLIHI